LPKTTVPPIASPIGIGPSVTDAVPANAKTPAQA